MVRGTPCCCASGGNHLTFKILSVLIRLPTASTHVPDKCRGPWCACLVFFFASQADHFFLNHLIQNNSAITLLQPPFWAPSHPVFFFKVLSLELPWSSSILLACHHGDVLGLNSVLSRCTSWQQAVSALMRPTEGSFRLGSHEPKGKNTHRKHYLWEHVTFNLKMRYFAKILGAQKKSQSCFFTVSPALICFLHWGVELYIVPEIWSMKMLMDGSHWPQYGIYKEMICGQCYSWIPKDFSSEHWHYRLLLLVERMMFPPLTPSSNWAECRAAREAMELDGVTYAMTMSCQQKAAQWRSAAALLKKDPSNKQRAGGGFGSPGLSYWNKVWNI